MSTDETILQGETAQADAQRASFSDKPELADYELQHRLGRGSFGEVWMGVQKSTGQAVAVKFFFEGDLSYVRRELERLREVSDHFAVVGLIDANLDHAPPYLVMPLLARSLAQELEPPSSPQAAVWMGQLAAGLRYSHDKGLLHCDLKPSNVMLDDSGSARLVDFGQSRQQGEGVVAWGTLGSMAPEQAMLGNEGEHSSPGISWDIYGLGATMYRLLTGFYPYWSEEELHQLGSLPLANRLRRYRQHIQISPLVSLRRVNPKIDRDLADLIEACLRVRPEQRPPHMAAVLEDLERRDKGLPLLCRRPWSWGYLLSKWSRRPALVLATVASLALLTGAGYSYHRLSQANREQNRLIQNLTEQQAIQSQRVQDFEDAQLWWCRALQNAPEDPVLRLRLGREHFALVGYEPANGSQWFALQQRPELVELTEQGAFLWNRGSRQVLPAGKFLKASGRGTLLALSTARQCLIYDLEQRRELTRAISWQQPAEELAWDGNELVAVELQSISRWNTQGQLLQRLPRPPAAVTRLSADGRWLYLHDQGERGRLLEVSSGKSREVVGSAPAEDEPVFSPDSSWLRAGTLDQPVLLSLKGAAPWKLSDRFAAFVDEERVAQLRGSRLTVVSRQGAEVSLQSPLEALRVQASPGGDLLLVENAGSRFQLWDSRSGAFLTSKTMQNLARSPRQLGFSGDGSLLFGCDNSVSKLWDLSPPRPSWSVSTPGRVLNLAWGPQQQWLTAACQEGILRLSPEGKVLESKSWSARSYAFSPQGLGVAELEGAIQLFAPGHDQALAEFAPGQFEEACQRVYFSSDGQWLLASLPGFLKVWKLSGDKAQPVREVAIAEPPQQLALSADGKFVAALCGKLGSPKLKLGVWRLPELRGLTLAVSEIPFGGQPLQLSFAQDSSWLLAGSAGNLTTLSLREPRELARWQLQLDADLPPLMGPDWMLGADEFGSLQKVNLPQGSLAGPGWPQSSRVVGLARHGQVGLASNLEDTALLDLRDGSELYPRLGTAELTCMLWGAEALFAARENTLGCWLMPSATGSPDQVMRRWEKWTGRRINPERASVEELTPAQWKERGAQGGRPKAAVPP